MSNVVAGALWNLVRVVFLFLLVALVLLFILAKSGGAEEDGTEGAQAAAERFELSEGEFGKGWTDLKYRVKYNWTGGKLKYELLIHPYDRRMESLRQSGNELVLLSFVDENRKRVIPLKSPIRLEMRDLEPVEVENEQGQKYFKGWLCTGEVNKEEGSDAKIGAAEMGWLFSDDLLSLLRDIRKERLIREAQQRAKESRRQPKTPVSTR